MKKITSLIILYSIVVAMLIGCGADKKYAVYSCENEEDANRCDNSCKLDSGYVFQFKIAKEINSVMLTSIEKDKIIGSIIFDKCKIFDEKNWDCSHGDATGLRSTTSKMINGIFTNYTSYWDRVNKSVIHEGGSVCSK